MVSEIVWVLKILQSFEISRLTVEVSSSFAAMEMVTFSPLEKLTLSM